jgi:dihydroneopterin aldolase / 2-amino-4-hydroxy-6-hydroxymethyldihydropteridine diphosphokinase
MTRAALALGANLGEPRVALRQAVASLSARPDVQVQAVSGLWRTVAVGGPEQPDYLNAVVLVDTVLDARALLGLAQELEAAAGRRRVVRWGPRTLDVDVLAVDDERHSGSDLTVPHPRAHERGFVLAPWAQVDPGFVLAPAESAARTVAQWAVTVADQQVTLVDGGPWWR